MLMDKPDTIQSGYVPEGIGVGAEDSDDYVEFTYCLDCGQIQGEFPVFPDAIRDCVDCGEPCDKGKKRCPNCWELAEQLPWEGGDVRR